MAIEITNNGGSIKIKNGAVVRHIFKAQILEVSVIKGNTIKIDIGQGALHNVFAPFAEVTIPVAGNVDALRDVIADMLDPDAAPMGGATEAKQIEQITKLTDLNTAIATLQTSVATMDSKLSYEDPMRVDDSGAEILYKGFSNKLAPVDGQADWAIQRIRKENGIDVYTWANGDRAFDKVWDNREALIYS